jgi:hypothetical protein
MKEKDDIWVIDASCLDLLHKDMDESSKDVGDGSVWTRRYIARFNNASFLLR